MISLYGQQVVVKYLYFSLDLAEPCINILPQLRNPSFHLFKARIKAIRNLQ